MLHQTQKVVSPSSSSVTPASDKLCRSWIHSGSDAEQYAADMSSKICQGLHSNNSELRRTAVYSAAIAKNQTVKQAEDQTRRNGGYMSNLMLPLSATLLGPPSLTRLVYCLSLGPMWFASTMYFVLTLLLLLTHRSYRELKAIHQRMSEATRLEVATMHSTIIPAFGSHIGNIDKSGVTSTSSDEDGLWMIEVLNPTCTGTLLILLLLALLAQGGLIASTLTYFVAPVFDLVTPISNWINNSHEKMYYLSRMICIGMMGSVAVLLTNLPMKHNRLNLVYVILSIAFITVILTGIVIVKKSIQIDDNTSYGTYLYDDETSTVMEVDPFTIVTGLQYATAGWFSVEFSPTMALIFQTSVHDSKDDQLNGGRNNRIRGWFMRGLPFMIVIISLILYGILQCLYSDLYDILKTESLPSKQGLGSILGLLKNGSEFSGNDNYFMIYPVCIIGTLAIWVSLVRVLHMASIVLSGLINTYSSSIPAFAKIFKGRLSKQRSKIVVCLSIFWLSILGQYADLTVISSVISLSVYGMFHIMTAWVMKFSSVSLIREKERINSIKHRYSGYWGKIAVMAHRIFSDANSAIFCGILSLLLIMFISPICALIVPLHILVLYRYISSISSSVKFRKPSTELIKIPLVRWLCKKFRPQQLLSWRPSILCIPYVTVLGKNVIINDPDLIAITKALQSSGQVSLIGIANNEESTSVLRKNDGVVPTNPAVQDSLKRAFVELGLQCKNFLLMVRKELHLSDILSVLSLGGNRNTVIITSYPLYESKIEFNRGALEFDQMSIQCQKHGQNLVVVKSNDTLCPISVYNGSGIGQVPVAPMFTHSNSIDLWWWSGNTPLGILISHLLSKTKQFNNCHVRLFICLDHSIPSEKYVDLCQDIKDELQSLGISFINDVTILCVDKAPLFPDDCDLDDAIIGINDGMMHDIGHGVVVLEPVGEEEVPDFLVEAVTDASPPVVGVQLALPSTTTMDVIINDDRYIVNELSEDISLHNQERGNIEAASKNMKQLEEALSDSEMGVDRTSILSSLPWPFKRQPGDIKPPSEAYFGVAQHMNSLIQYYSASATVVLTMFPMRPPNVDSPLYLQFIDMFMHKVDRSILLIDTLSNSVEEIL